MENITNSSRDLTQHSATDNLCDLLNNEATYVIIFVNHVILSSLFGLCGTVANVINICVFVKEGLNNSMNISFLSLSVSDLCSLVTLLWMNICLNPYISRAETTFVFSEILYLTAGWPHGCSARVTSWITAYITAERCLSITAPLQVKRIVTPKRTVLVITFIYLINIFSLLPEYTTVYYDWKYYSDRNKSMVGLAFRSYKSSTDGLVFILHAGLSFTSFFLVIVFTIILVFKLKQNSLWRQNALSEIRQNENLSIRDKKVVSMIIVLASVLVVCYTPTVMLSIISSCVPGFSVVGKLANSFNAAWSFGFLLHSINSNINILLYFRMSSKFRSKFRELFALSVRVTDAAPKNISNAFAESNTL